VYCGNGCGGNGDSVETVAFLAASSAVSYMKCAGRCVCRSIGAWRLCSRVVFAFSVVLVVVFDAVSELVLDTACGDKFVFRPPDCELVLFFIVEALVLVVAPPFWFFVCRFVSLPRRLLLEELSETVESSRGAKIDFSRLARRLACCFAALRVSSLTRERICVSDVGAVRSTDSSVATVASSVTSCSAWALARSEIVLELAILLNSSCGATMRSKLPPRKPFTAAGSPNLPSCKLLLLRDP
jgi:hypothetical protein